MQFHASLITADGAYHCPVGSIRPFLNGHFSLDPGLFIKLPQSIWAKCDISIIVKTNMDMDMDTNIIVNIDNNGRLHIGLEPLYKNT